MAAGYHLKNILSILMSLANDPHPTVHFWALESLSRVADSAGLTFSSYVSSTLGMLAQLYASDSHNEEANSLASSNLEIEMATPIAIVRCVGSVINVLGPDLQDKAKAREMIMTLIEIFQQETNILILVESLRCQENIALYAPGHMHYEVYVRYLQTCLKSELILIRDTALNGYHNLIRSDAKSVLRTAEAGLDEQMWTVLNQSPDQQIVHNIIRNWLEQTALTETVLWVQRCQNILSKVIKKEAKRPTEAPRSSARPGPDLQDEEVAGFAAAAGANQEDVNTNGPTTQELLRWQVRTFAMECLGEVIDMVGKDAVVNDESVSLSALQSKVADVIRVAFSASTGGVVELRIQGLKIVDQILKVLS
jgi:HEAT repeat-containing protein 5